MVISAMEKNPLGMVSCNFKQNSKKHLSGKVIFKLKNELYFPFCLECIVPRLQSDLDPTCSIKPSPFSGHVYNLGQEKYVWVNWDLNLTGAPMLYLAALAAQFFPQAGNIPSFF